MRLISKKFFFGLILGIWIINGCEKSNKTDKGNVSFGVNTHIINCIATGEVFIDDKSIGIIPGSCDAVVDCNAANTLNKEISVGKHSYKIEVKGQSGSCCKIKEGSIDLKKNDCIKIFMDLSE
jgi:hypothetical protein